MMSDTELEKSAKILPATIESAGGMAQVDAVIFKRYLELLSQCPVIKADPVALSEIAKRICLNKLSKLVYDKEEDRLDKLNGALAALHGNGASLLVVIKSDGKSTDLYLGVRASSASVLNAAQETLSNALAAGFPGIRMSKLGRDPDTERLLKEIETAGCVVAVTGIPSLKDAEKKSFVQGIEKIIDGMNGQRYTALLIADPVMRQELEASEAGYHQLYSILSMLAENQITLSENESRSIGTTLNETFSQTLTDSLTESQTTTKGTNTSKTRTRSIGPLVTLGAAAVGAKVGAIVGAPLGMVAGTFVLPGFGTVAGGVSGSAVGAAAGGAIGSVVGTLASALIGSTSTSKGENESKANGKSKSRSIALNKSESKGTSDNVTSGTGKSVQFTVKDRRLMELLNLIDEQLERIRVCKNYGMWNWGAYFVGNDLPVIKMGANLYSGILRGESTGIEASAINVWDKDFGVTDAERQDAEIKCNATLAHLSQMQHPVMAMPEGFAIGAATTCSLVSTPELCIGMSLPQKSVPGIPVMEAIGFGRAVSYVTELTNEPDGLPLGNIMHMGRVETSHLVKLAKSSLTAHMFVTGSTGSGKSNTVYHLLSSLWNEGKPGCVPFLVIEPAKGEYKKVFGGYEKVKVFGTNPTITPLLQINPFAFPEKIHVVEHIDRLIDILNAVWPMYAAMPAILKEAVECAYRNMGWDLLTSTCQYATPIFPDFEDLLDVLPDIIGTSDYSQEMKGNYAGALLTRVRSMTNGYFRSIFQKEEISAEVLFDGPCIVDLSRVGSAETKALLMGVVFLKLQEYRMANATTTNSELKHVTVLEEAHNLLRCTSAEQSQEGANLQGKSVEMISNAIAEMRTYGEAFIIVDQAPGLLDKSVIRNTNTKIIHRLPYREDRELVGKAANLKEEQLEELARLPTGCAAVYQNNWLEAVLCQISEFPGQKLACPFDAGSVNVSVRDSRKHARTQLVRILLEALSGRGVTEIASEHKEPIESFIPYFATTVDAITHGKDDKEWLLSHLREVLQVWPLIGTIKEKEAGRWIACLLNGVFAKMDGEELSLGEREGMVVAVFEILKRGQPKNSETWQHLIGEAERWLGVLV